MAMTAEEIEIEREMRMERNRQSARDCRKRKKDKIQCLEQQVEEADEREAALTDTIRLLQAQVAQLRADAEYYRQLALSAGAGAAASAPPAVASPMDTGLSDDDDDDDDNGDDDGPDGMQHHGGDHEPPTAAPPAAPHDLRRSHPGALVVHESSLDHMDVLVPLSPSSFELHDLTPLASAPVDAFGGYSVHGGKPLLFSHEPYAGLFS